MGRYLHINRMRRKAGALVPLELAICTAAVELRGQGTEEFHGYLIAKEIKEHADNRLLTAYGTLYRALGRLESMGLLTSRWEDAMIAADEKKPRLGILWDADGRMSVAHPGPVEQVYKSVTSTLNTIGAVASPKSDVKLQHMSGPVGIGRIYYLLFQTDRGWQLALWFSVVLNVNLAILNMLPIPVLDGGHIVLAIIESIRRKPVNIRILEVVQTACAVLIIGYMVYVSFFDIGDLVGRDNDEPRPATQTTATPAP